MPRARRGAILFFLAARGTWAGVLLSYFAPLPLMVATLGFGFTAGGAAVLTGALVAGVVALADRRAGGRLRPAPAGLSPLRRGPPVAPDDRRAARSWSWR